MSRKGNNKLAAVLFGPALVIGGVMALWENEGRFDYHAAARDATVIGSPNEAIGEPVAYTANLDTGIPIYGDYIEQFDGYHMVSRYAEIYSWDKSTDSDGNTKWSIGWHSSLDGNSRNSGLQKQLSSADLYPERYRLGDMEVSPDRIHLVDDSVGIDPAELTLARDGRILELQRQGGYLYLDKGRSDDLGDERVSYSGIPNAPTASYFGLVQGGLAVGKQFEKNEGIISAIIQNDGILHHLANGDRETALATIKADLTFKTWIVRIGGTVAVCFGFFIFFSVFMSLLYRIPLLGNVVEFGVFLISAILGLSISLVVILTGLIVHNPFSVALPLALVIGGVIWFLRRSRTAGKNARRQLDARLAAQGGGAAAAAGVAGLSAPAAPSSPPPPPVPGAAPATPPAEVPSMATASADLSSTQLIERSFTNLALVAMSEGKLHKRENKFLTEWGKQNGIAPERMKELFAAARNDPPEAHLATRDDLQLMALMAMADGVLSMNEWHFLWKIAEPLGLKPGDLRQMLRDIEDGVAEPAT